MMPVENDRPPTSDITDGPPDSIDEDPFNDRGARKVDDSLNVYRWALARECHESSRPIASELVAHVTIYTGHAGLSNKPLTANPPAEGHALSR
jgi:hypothetical protein